MGGLGSNILLVLDDAYEEYVVNHDYTSALKLLKILKMLFLN